MTAASTTDGQHHHCIIYCLAISLHPFPFPTTRSSVIATLTVLSPLPNCLFPVHCLSVNSIPNEVLPHCTAAPPRERQLFSAANQSSWNIQIFISSRIAKSDTVCVVGVDESVFPIKKLLMWKYTGHFINISWMGHGYFPLSLCLPTPPKSLSVWQWNLICYTSCDFRRK